MNMGSKIDPREVADFVETIEMPDDAAIEALPGTLAERFPGITPDDYLGAAKLLRRRSEDLMRRGVVLVYAALPQAHDKIRFLIERDFSLADFLRFS